MNYLSPSELTTSGIGLLLPRVHLELCFQQCLLPCTSSISSSPRQQVLFLKHILAEAPVLLYLAKVLVHVGVLTLVSGQLDPAVDNTRPFVAHSHRGHTAAPSQNTATSAQHSNQQVCLFVLLIKFKEVRKT